MRSIDNLREWWRDRFPVMDRQLGCDFREHIDAIEFEVKELTDERDLLKTQWEAGVDFDQRLESCAENREDVTLWGVDYTPLPVDADGEAIHVGDVMVYADGDTCPLPVVALVPPAVFITEEGPRYADMCRHHHAPTVEDVLDEFANRLYEKSAYFDEDHVQKAIAEYAAKLRLAGEDA